MPLLETSVDHKREATNGWRKSNAFYAPHRSIYRTELGVLARVMSYEHL